MRKATGTDNICRHRLIVIIFQIKLYKKNIFSTDHLSRRRRRRELEGTKSLIHRVEPLNFNRMRDVLPNDNTPLAQLILRHNENTSIKNPLKNGMNSPKVERCRSSTVSPKGLVRKSHQSHMSDHNTSDSTSSSLRSKRSTNSNALIQSEAFCDTKYLQKNMRLLELSHKMERTKERTKAELAQIELITAKCNNSAELIPETVCDLNASSLSVSSTDQPVNCAAFGDSDSTKTSRSNHLVMQPFQKKDRISFFDDNFLSNTVDASTTSFFKDRKRSHSTEEKYTFCDAILDDDDFTTTMRSRPSSTPSSELHLEPRKSPNSRRKSSEDSGITATNHIVSILKKKDQNESSSASSNASPVTFSSSVLDTPTRSVSRQGILKKRSSLDESRYSRSHSPDERSVLVRTPRRNSLEELQPGILKQRSYDSKTDLSVHNEPHGILKKKENCTPSSSETHSKHVSISEAVILAAAELCKDAVCSDDEEYEIRPILKQDTPTISTPRPILKKKYSSESEEIRPILKTSRKSSREESDNDDYARPTARKSDSPAKRRSFCDPFETNVVLERSRSMENHDQDRAAFVQPTSLAISEKPLVSVAERIKNMEKVLTGDKSAMNRRESNRQRFKTQPVTVNEISW